MPAPQLAPAASPAALPAPAAPGAAPLTASMPAPASRTTKPKRPYVPGIMQVQVGGSGQTAPRKMYPIRQALNRQRDLKDGPIRLLIEVCEIYENGGRRSCYATNSSLGEILGRGKTQISKWLDYLERAGWLHLEHHPEQGNTRLLIPTERARQSYGAQEPEPGHPPIAESATPPPKVKVEKNRKPRQRTKDETATPPVVESATPIHETATGVLETARLDYQQSTSSKPTSSLYAGEGLDFQKKIGGVNAAQAPAPPPAPLPPAPAPAWPKGTVPPPPSGPGPDDKPKQGSEQSQAMTAKLAAYFGVGELAHSGHYAELGRFCRYVEGQGALDYLAQQFAAYVAQKQLTGQSIGSWTNYIAAGTETFTGGKWRMQCWVHKLGQDLAEPQNQAKARAQGPEAIQQYLALVPAASAYFTSTTPSHAAAHSPRQSTGKPSPSRYAIPAVDFDTDD